MQLLACNVDVKNTTVNVSAATGKLANEPFTQPAAKWHDWQLPEPSFDPLLSIVCSCYIYIYTVVLTRTNKLHSRRQPGRRPAILRMAPEWLVPRTFGDML